MFIKNPKVKFVIDPKEDIKNYILFNKYKYAASDPKTFKMFLPQKLHYILKSRFSEKQKAKIVKAYVKNTFILHKKEIAQNTDRAKKEWHKVAKDYFRLMNRIFKDHPWPKGKYIGFASVFEMYPKNVKEKIFYFSGLKKDLNFNIATIAHEMLHFMFFDYIDKNTRVRDRGSENIWNASEVFNLVIETWKPYQKIFKTNGKAYYFMHKKMLPKMKKLWKEKEDIDYLLNHYF